MNVIRLDPSANFRTVPDSFLRSIRTLRTPCEAVARPIDVAAPDRRVVLGGAVVGVVHLRGTAGDVAVGVDPDLSEPEPAVVAVRAGADLDATAHRFAATLPRAGNYPRVERVPRGVCRPVARCRPQITVPGARNV